MTPHDPLYFLCLGLVFGIGFTGMLVGLLIILSDRSKRNGDVGTPIEQYYRFADYCAEQTTPMPVTDEYDICVNCPLKDAQDCRISWMNMPYKKEDK